MFKKQQQTTKRKKGAAPSTLFSLLLLTDYQVAKFMYRKMTAVTTIVKMILMATQL